MDKAMEIWHAAAEAERAHGSQAAAQVIREALDAEIADLKRELRIMKGPTPDEVETVQQACERGWALPFDPKDWIEMTEDAAAFLATAALKAQDHQP